jgi:dihydrofolate reductase
MNIALIAALTENRVLGKDNQLIWHLPKDLKHFKQTTTGHPVVMGRKTYESFGKPLPNRTNIIVSRNREYEAEGCIVRTSLMQAIEEARKYAKDIVFIAGGGEIYRQALPLADLMYLTHIHATLEGDAFFPEFEKDEWKVVATESIAPDDKHPYAFDIVTWKRVKLARTLHGTEK